MEKLAAQSRVLMFSGSHSRLYFKKRNLAFDFSTQKRVQHCYCSIHKLKSLKTYFQKEDLFSVTSKRFVRRICFKKRKTFGGFLFVVRKVLQILKTSLVVDTTKSHTTQLSLVGRSLNQFLTNYHLRRHISVHRQSELYNLS